MAQLIGGLATSHIPAIGGAIHKGKQQDPYWKPFFDGIALERTRRDFWSRPWAERSPSESFDAKTSAVHF